MPDAEKFAARRGKLRRNRLLIFSRWCQVVCRFEMALYDNPEQDLNRVWWDLVEKYQEVKRPEGRNQPDYASKIHIVTAPVYYQSYMMGELFASQVHHAIARVALGGADPATAIYVGNPAVGRFMRERVFSPGCTLDWNQLTRHATGEELNSRAFAEDLKDQWKRPFPAKPWNSTKATSRRRGRCDRQRGQQPPGGRGRRGRRDPSPRRAGDHGRDRRQVSPRAVPPARR